ncbi:MAG: YciI family protein [Microbacteriaceae bacterium]
MRFLFLVCTDSTAEPYLPAEDNIAEWFADVTARGAHVIGDRLRPEESAVTVKRRDGHVVTTDGPFAETKELIAGFDVIDCESREEAIEIASRHPMARFGQIDVREFWPLG